MKFVLKIGVPLISLMLILFLVYIVSLPWNPFASQKKTALFLDAVQTQKYEEASNLFGGTINKKSWVDEIQDLHKNQGFKLLSYDNVKAEFDDGSFSTGHADLNFEFDGKPLRVRAILTFNSYGKPKQVCAIHPPETKPTNEQFNVEAQV